MDAWLRWSPGRPLAQVTRTHLPRTRERANLSPGGQGRTLRRVQLGAELAGRYDLDIRADLDSSISVDFDQQHDLLRITREAIANAVHHGKAKRVRVSLSCDGELHRLSIEDDGQSFDVSASVANDVGHGLIGMRERASALPGDFTVRAHPGVGCVVSVQW